MKKLLILSIATALSATAFANLGENNGGTFVQTPTMKFGSGSWVGAPYYTATFSTNVFSHNSSNSNANETKYEVIENHPGNSRWLTTTPINVPGYAKGPKYVFNSGINTIVTWNDSWDATLVTPTTTVPYLTQGFIDHRNGQIFPLWNGAILAIVYQETGYRFINAEGDIQQVDAENGRKVNVISSSQDPLFGKVITPTKDNNVIIEYTRANESQNIRLESISAVPDTGGIHKKDIKIYPLASQNFQWSSVHANTIGNTGKQYWTINGCSHYALNNCNGAIKNSGVILVDRKGRIEAVNPPSKDKNSFLANQGNLPYGGTLITYTDTPNANIFLADGTFVEPAENKPDLGAIPAPKDATSVRGGSHDAIFYNGTRTATVINGRTGAYYEIEAPKNAGDPQDTALSPENHLLLKYQKSPGASEKSPTVVSVNISNGKRQYILAPTESPVTITALDNVYTKSGQKGDSIMNLITYFYGPAQNQKSPYVKVITNTGKVKSMRHHNIIQVSPFHLYQQ